MTQETRRKEIIHMLQSCVSLETNKLASMFAVSPVTIRRDFEYFEKMGLGTTIYGGAMVNRTLPDLEEDISRHRIQEKRMIAKAAADLVQRGIRSCWTREAPSRSWPSNCWQSRTSRF